MNRKSTIFSEYNKQRSTARKAGKDTARINRGLGLALSGKARPYLTTAHTCDCPDARYRGVVCKHMIAARLNSAGKTTDQLLEELGF